MENARPSPVVLGPGFLKVPATMKVVDPGKPWLTTIELPSEATGQYIVVTVPIQMVLTKEQAKAFHAWLDDFLSECAATRRLAAATAIVGATVDAVKQDRIRQTLGAT
jgi:hypothetical protein